MIILQIADWHDHFENSRTEKIKNLGWLPIPVKQDGDGYTELLDHECGAMHYAAWVAMVLIAGKCAVRGTLLRGGSPLEWVDDVLPRGGNAVAKLVATGAKPHDSGSMSRISRVPSALFDEAIPRLLSIGWLEVIDETGQRLTADCHDIATAWQRGGNSWQPRAHARNGKEPNCIEQNGTESNCTELNRTEQPLPAAPASVSDCDAVVLHYQTYHPKARPGEKERKLIRARLKDGYSVQDLCDAIDGNHLSPWHCGENEDGREYHAIDLIVRSGDKVAQFIGCKENPRTAVTSLQTKRNAAAADSYLEKRRAIDGILG